MNATDEMPRWVLPLKKCLDRCLRFRKLGSKRFSDLGPQRLEHRCRDVLGHRRRSGRERFEFGELGRRYRRMMCVVVGMRANGRDKSSGEVAPVAQVRWKRGSHFGGAELEQSVPRATTEGALEPAQQRARRWE